MQLRRLELTLLPVIGFALWGGCDQPEMTAPLHPEESPASETTVSDKDLLAEVKVEENHAVRFYGRPSSVFVVEELPRGQRSALGADNHANALEMYKALRPGEEVPRALRDAHERARLAAPVTRGKTPAGLVASGGAALAQLGSFFAFDQNTSSSNPANFVNSLGGCMWSNVNSTCKISWFNGFHSGTATSNNLRCIVDHFSGDGISVVVASNSSFNFTPQAVNKTFIYVEIGGAPDVRYCEIFNASGDGFHVGTQWF
jgi:hypothetical protein